MKFEDKQKIVKKNICEYWVGAITNKDKNKSFTTRKEHEFEKILAISNAIFCSQNYRLSRNEAIYWTEYVGFALTKCVCVLCFKRRSKISCDGHNNNNIVDVCNIYSVNITKLKKNRSE